MHTVNLTFESNDHRLSGTLTVPESRPAMPAAVLVSGSGPIDRDSNMKRAKLGVMQQVAAHLADRGIATLRYDKRGVAESEGNYKAAGLHDNVADARAAVAALRDRPEIDPEQVFVIGHSEGALIAAELAAETDADRRLAGVVLLAGGAQPGKAVLQWQAGQIAGSLPGPVKFLMKVLRKDLVGIQAKRFAQLEATTTDVARIQMVKVNAKWFREFMTHDPSESLRKATVPVLAITGSKDIQVDPADITLIEQLVPTACEGHVLENVTHLLRSDDGPATTRTYKQQMKRPLDRNLLDLVASWIENRDRQTA